MTARHYLQVTDLTADDVLAVLARARKLKAKWRATGKPSRKLRGATLAAIYEKPSLRTRVTFDVAMAQLGGHTVNLGDQDIRMGQREAVADVARNLSRWVQIIAARTFSHDTVVELARYSSVPVINSLSDREHPVQALADFMTFGEHVGELQGRKLAYVGDGNNVAHSLMLMGASLGVNVAVAGPLPYAPASEFLTEAQTLAQVRGAEVTYTPDISSALAGADAVYTDVWTSMGQEQERDARLASFVGYQVTEAMMEATGKPATIFMHCLPAHRGEEVAAELLDGARSVVFDQAENRLHVQKALLLFLLEK